MPLGASGPPRDVQETARRPKSAPPNANSNTEIVVFFLTLERDWGSLEASWGPLGVVLGVVGAILSSIGSLLGRLGSLSAALGGPLELS